MINRFRLFLGPERLQLLFFLLALTGLGSLILNSVVDEFKWARPAQTTLFLIFVLGALFIIGSKLDSFDRGRWASLLIPSFLAVIIGVLFVPDWLPLLVGGSIGWIIAGLFLFKPNGPMEYQVAVKHMRKNQYEEAVKALDRLIKQEPTQPRHYRFRAEVFRLWGKLDRARRDYEKMLEVSPDETSKAVAYNGLAEVQLQSGRYDIAKTAALKAFELAPDEWVAAYNLGMIEDRLKQSTEAVEHLNLSLKAKVPDSRHRLLIHFYLARAYARLNNLDEASREVKVLKKHPGGLNEWNILLQSDQAETLRAVLESDIKMAEALVNDEMTLEALGQS